MAFYKKQADKKSGDGLALTEWNDLHNAVAGNAGLTLALHPDDKIGIGTETPEEAMEIKKTSPVLSIHNPNVSTFKIGSDANGFKIAAMDNGFGGHRGNFPNNNSQVFFMSKTGNVGIGITKLNERLEVNGNVKAAKFIGDGSQLTNLSVGATGLNLATTANSRVGIGISAPQAKLHVINAESDANGNTLILGPTTGSNLRMGYHKDYSWIQSHGSKPLHINPVGNNLIIGEGASVGIGTSSPEDKLHLNGTLRLSGAGNHCQMWMESKKLLFRIKSSTHGENKGISWDGDNNWDSFSDQRLKTNIVKEKDILPRLMQLDVKNYNWKDDPNRKIKLIGFMAQDVKPLFPSLVGEIEDTETKESTLTLKYASFGVLAVGAIKELKLEHDRRIAALEAEIAEMKEALVVH